MLSLITICCLFIVVSFSLFGCSVAPEMSRTEVISASKECEAGGFKATIIRASNYKVTKVVCLVKIKEDKECKRYFGG